jgi:CRISPR-associated endoribonuclease Cas6
MRFRITFSITGKYRMIPVDYQYTISAWIYRVIGKADAGFSAFLHHQGYSTGNKRFKLFCYSPLSLGKPIPWKEKSLFEITVAQVDLSLSFAIPEAAEKFVIGLFSGQDAYLGDRFNGLELLVKQVERLPDPVLSETMHYRATSPVVAGDQEGEKKYAQYLPPEDLAYPELIRNNLEMKLKSLPDYNGLPVKEPWIWKLTGTPRSKLILIRPYTPQQSRVRGFLYPFSLTAPVAFHQLILSAGAGEKNSTGFGWVEVMNEPVP